MRKRVSPAVAAEADLARAWARAGEAGTVRTTAGEPLTVLYPGRPNGGPGPDFLDAVLLTETGVVRGAVEVHRRRSDWARHRHGADARYAGVVLHVVGNDDGVPGNPPGGPSGGGQLPLLEIGAHPDAWPPGSEGRETAPELLFPCARATRAGHDHQDALAAAGEARFAATAEALRRALDAGADGEQVVYEAVAEALGYERNAAPMRELAGAVPLAALRSAIRQPGFAGAPARAVGRPDAGGEAEALLLGRSGLLPSQRHLPVTRRGGAVTAAREAAWKRLKVLPALKAYRWDVAGVRPENAPVRRVVALAHLGLRWPAGGMRAAVARILSAIGSESEHRRAAGGGDQGERSSGSGGELGGSSSGSASEQGGSGSGEPSPQRAGQALAQLVGLPAAGYWRGHWDFGLPAPGGAGALIGAARAADVVVNVLLPLASAMAGAVPGPTLRPRSGASPAAPPSPPASQRLDAAARAVLRAFPPLAENRITRLVRQRAALPAPRRAVVQQGLIAVYEAACRDLRCDVCPLALHAPDAGPVAFAARG